MNIEGSTISVSGFDFNANFVSETPRDDNFYGKKLIIEFIVSPKPEFLGGNQVPTNVNTSGVYTGETLVEAFTEPHVDVPIPKITVTASDKNVYLLAGLDSDALVEGAVVKAGDVTIDFSKSEENYGLDTWQNAFVDISSTGTGPEGAQLSNLREDTSYTLTVTVAPKYTGTELETTGSDSGQIYVFKPEIHWQDTCIDAGNTPVYKSDEVVEQNFVSLSWIHATVTYDVDKMIGDAPTLSYDYTPAAAELTEETPVKVTVKIDNQDVTTDSVFVHDECTFENCKWETEYEGKGYHFVVHLNTFDLTIKKVVQDANLDPNQTFVFKVTGPNDFSMEVVIKGNGSTTIKNLAAGDYTVTEDTGWSWRYDPISNGLTGSPENPVVTFSNTRNNDYWLDGNAYCKNVFDGITASN